MIEPGVYKAKVVDYAITTTSSGNLQMSICFGFDDNKRLNWYGSFKEGKAREITLKALLTCGLKHNDLNKLADGLASDSLDTEKELEIKVIVGKDLNGNDRNEIHWINEVGASGFRNLISKAEVIKMGGLTPLSADLLALRQKEGFRSPQQQQGQQAANSALDDIPF